MTAMMRLAVLAAAVLSLGCGAQTMTVQQQPGPTVLSPPEPGETEVLAEGAAAVTSTADIARDHALSDALRKAVEQGVGVFIDSETQVSNFQLIEDNIYSRASGYVSSYRIIDEGLSGGLYRVTIRASVKTGSIEDDLAAVGLLLAEQGRPRVMVLVRELAGGQDLDDVTMGASMFETQVMDHFRARGFPVVDAATVQSIMEADQLRLVLEGDDRTAALLGLRAGAEIVVSGTALHDSENRLIAGSERSVHEYRVSSRAVNTATGALLAASAITVELPFSESQARSRAADSTASYLESVILQGWTQNDNLTEIVAVNADFSRVQTLRSRILNSVRGVSDVVTRDLTGGRATLEVVSSTSSSEVMDGLFLMEDLLTITGFSGNRVEIDFL